VKGFFDERFLIDNDTSFELYRSVKELPICDYHCHLSPKEIYEDNNFDSLGELWLKGDHYKWRLMRAAGIDEYYISGNADWDSKFLAFAEILPLAVGNPIYHWVHMELKEYFSINEPLNKKSAKNILRKANEIIKSGKITPRKLIAKSRVETICTTDDIADSLEYHKLLKKEGYEVKVVPTFRADKAICGINKDDFYDYVVKVTGTKKPTFDKWLTVITEKLDYFYSLGCVLADIGMETLPHVIGEKEMAEKIFNYALTGKQLHETDTSIYIGFMLEFFASQFKKRNMVLQLHLSPIRNNSKKLYTTAGVDSGNDSVGEKADVLALCNLLNNLDAKNSLPKMIVYSLNPNAYYEISTMLGNFWGSAKGNLMLGAAWWFCDHKDGIREQLKALSFTALLGRFTGMLTDSRSFTAFTRHDYFRRILCNYIGEQVEKGEYDKESAFELVKAVSIDNAREFFGL